MFYYVIYIYGIFLCQVIFEMLHILWKDLFISLSAEKSEILCWLESREYGAELQSVTANPYNK